jgi:hypothetical protein
VRHHEQSLQGGLSLTQWMSLGFALAGAVWLWRGARVPSHTTQGQG